MRLFAKSEPPHRTALAMIGTKPGQSVVVLGADGPLAAAIGLVTGLNGRTVVVDPAGDAADRVRAAADHEGALIEFFQEPLAATPLDTAAFDLAVVRAGLAARPASERTAVIAEAFRLVRDSGRIIVVEGATRAGVLGRRTTEPALATAAITTLLTAAGGRGIRELAQVEGISYFEARR